jgi:hypothetical protein
LGLRLGVKNAKGYKKLMQKHIEYEVGDVVKLKKPHPCGQYEWEILRVGMDFRLKCIGCGHIVMMPRKIVEKNTRNLKKNLS